MSDAIGRWLKDWRKTSGVKQQELARLLGVTQTAVSRWESGLDVPSAAVYGKIRDLVSQKSSQDLRLRMSMTEMQLGLRILVDIDGLKLLSSTRAFKQLWPQLADWQGRNTADHLAGHTADLYANVELMKAIRRDEVVLAAGVSDRHLKGFDDHAFRHYWTAAYHRIGASHYAEISFEACSPNAELGLHRLLRVDEVM